MEEEGYNGIKGMVVKWRPNPNLSDDFFEFGLKIGCYSISYRKTIGWPSSPTRSPVLLQEIGRKLRKWFRRWNKALEM